MIYFHKCVKVKKNVLWNRVDLDTCIFSILSIRTLHISNVAKTLPIHFQNSREITARDQDANGKDLIIAAVSCFSPNS